MERNLSSVYPTPPQIMEIILATDFTENTKIFIKLNYDKFTLFREKAQQKPKRESFKHKWETVWF